MYTDLIFDLYGTLVDIHTEENDLVWDKTALYMGYYGADMNGAELQAEFRRVMALREAQAGQSYECFPEIPFEQVLAQLLEERGVEDAARLGLHAAQLFRVASTEYIRLYPGVKEALRLLRERGLRLWLLSNAQRVFTACEMRHLGLGEEFDGVYLSSDYGVRKPDVRFFRKLLEEQGLEPAQCLMIGNDRETDIAGAMAAGLDTLYMHTNLTPRTQEAAHPRRRGRHREFEGSDWRRLVRRLLK